MEAGLFVKNQKSTWICRTVDLKVDNKNNLNQSNLRFVNVWWDNIEIFFQITEVRKSEVHRFSAQTQRLCEDDLQEELSDGYKIQSYEGSSLE